VTKRLGTAQVLIAAGGVLAASEACSALVRRDLAVLNVHWLLEPILGIANAPTSGGSLGTTGVGARLLADAIVLAALAVLWLASRRVAFVRSGLFRFGLGLFMGGVAANAYQWIVTGRVLDWITFPPLVAVGLRQGYPTYSLGDIAIASGLAVLVSFALINSRRSQASS
jgi:hypothetical protein